MYIKKPTEKGETVRENIKLKYIWRRDLSSDMCQIPNSSFQSDWINLKWNEADSFQNKFSHMSYSATVISKYVYPVLVRTNLQVQTSHSIRLERIAKTFNKGN